LRHTTALKFGSFPVGKNRQRKAAAPATK